MIHVVFDAVFPTHCDKYSLFNLIDFHPHRTYQCAFKKINKNQVKGISSAWCDFSKLQFMTIFIFIFNTFNFCLVCFYIRRFYHIWTVMLATDLRWTIKKYILYYISPDSYVADLWNSNSFSQSFCFVCSLTFQVSVVIDAQNICRPMYQFDVNKIWHSNCEIRFTIG